MEHTQDHLPLPSPRHMEWYRRGKIAFIHFSMNTFTDFEWGDGREKPEIFAPTALDCRQWARVLKEGGFTAAILTVKHHDGFCLWPSAYTEHSVKHSPGAPDVVRLFTDACREFGLKPGVYISPWDRNHPSWGTAAYDDVFAGQLTELMTQYGTLWECWWDGAGSTEATYDWARWAGIVRRYQPQCLIFGSMGATDFVDVRWVGNEEGHAGDDCWATIDPGSLRREVCAELNTGHPEGSRFIPAETNTSIRPGWFYHREQDDQVMTREELLEYWFRSAGRNTTPLLNLPPDRRGLIHEKDALAVKEWETALQEIFRQNLAAGGRVSGGAGGEAVLDICQDRIWEADSLCPEIRIDLPQEVEFDCFRLEEAIEHGHRIRRFAVEALTEEGWVSLEEGRCVGFCRAARFPPLRARAVRVRIMEAVREPVLRYFGIFRGAAPGKRQEETGRELTARVTHAGRELEVELGGVYTLDRVVLEQGPEDGWQVRIFNGTRYDPPWDARDGQCLLPEHTGAFRLKVTSDAVFPEDIRVRVFSRGRA